MSDLIHHDYLLLSSTKESPLLQYSSGSVFDSFTLVVFA